MFQIRILNGPLKGNTYALDDQLLVGRSPEADIQIIDAGISRRHCTLIKNDDGQFILVDLSSSNGTEVGGEQVKRLQLIPGDVFTVGNSHLVLEPKQEASAVNKEEEIKLASGPAVADTDVRPPESIGCGSPLHIIAVQREWAHCPNCGQKPSEEEALAIRGQF